MTPARDPKPFFFEKHLEAILGKREAEEKSGGDLDVVGGIWVAFGIWKASGKHLRGI